MKRSKGFTLVELLVVVGIISLLVMILMPTLTRARELAKQAICGANLNTLGKGVAIYMTEYDKFPLITDHGDSGAELSTATQAEEIWEEASGELVLTANAMQNFWVIIKTGTSEKAFQCPSDGDYQDRKAKSGDPALKAYGWIDKKNFSYGLHKPYDDSLGSGLNDAPLTDTPQGNFVIMADKGNGKSIFCKKDAEGNITTDNPPQNHKDDGFNCLTYQGSVKFHKIVVDSEDANSDAGIAGDDVYVAGDDDGETTIETAQDSSANPTDSSDAFIIPWPTESD